MIKPVTEFQNYFLKTSNNQLYGFDIQGVKKIDVIDQDGDAVTLKDFFTVSGNLYFTISEAEATETDGNTVYESVTKYYKQSEGEITEISELPTRPAIGRVLLSNSEFIISTFIYNGTTCSDVKNLEVLKLNPKFLERFIMVDGFCYLSGVGLYFNVSEGRGKARTPGLYFWNVGNMSIEKITECGEIW